MASDFVKNRAKKQREKEKKVYKTATIDRSYINGKYGDETNITYKTAEKPSSTETKSEYHVTTGKASDFVRQRAEKQRQNRIENYGTASYGQQDNEPLVQRVNKSSVQDTAIDMLRNRNKQQFMNNGSISNKYFGGLDESIIKKADKSPVRITYDKYGTKHFSLDREGIKKLEKENMKKFPITSAVSYGIVKGSGITSLVEALNRDKSINDVYEEHASEHPLASGAGNVAGNLALMLGTGGTVGKAAGGLVGKFAPKAASIASNAVTFALANSAQDLGDVVTGEIEPSRYARRVAVSGAAGAAGTIARNLVGTGIAKTLVDRGMQTPFMEFVRNTVSNTAFDVTDTATRQILSDKEDRLSGKDLGVQIATDFAFSMIESGMDTYNTTRDNKLAMQAAVDKAKNAYQAMTADSDKLTRDEAAQRAELIKEYTKAARRSINSHYVAGQQTAVNNFNSALDIIEQAMDSYIGGYNYENSVNSGNAKITAKPQTESTTLQETNPIAPTDSGSNDINEGFIDDLETAFKLGLDEETNKTANLSEETNNAVEDAINLVKAQKETESVSSDVSQEEIQNSTDLAIEMLKANGKNSKANVEINDTESIDNAINEGFEDIPDETSPIISREALENQLSVQSTAVENGVRYQVSRTNNGYAGFITHSDGIVDNGYHLYDSPSFNTMDEAISNILDVAENNGLISNASDVDVPINEGFESPEDTYNNTIKNTAETAQKAEETPKKTNIDNNKAEIKKRATARFGRFKKGPRQHYINSYSGQDIVDYDEAMSGAYMAGKNGDPISSLSDNENFNEFYRSNSDAVDAMWNYGYTEYEANKRNENGGVANGEVEEVHNEGRVSDTEPLQSGTDRGNGGVRSEENTAVQGGRGSVEVREKRGSDNVRPLDESDRSGASGRWGERVSEGDKVLDNGSRRGRRGVLKSGTESSDTPILDSLEVGSDISYNGNNYEIESFKDDKVVLKEKDSESDILPNGSHSEVFKSDVEEELETQKKAAKEPLKEKPKKKASKKAESVSEQVKQKDDIASQPQPKGNNYIIPSDGADIPTTESERYTANVDAINTLKNIISENRIATTEEQKVLSKFTGWGGISDAKWKKSESELKSILSEEEYSTASRSLLDAYYTDPAIINSIYNGLHNIGFNGGRLLEPSAGVGRFIGAMPKSMLPSVKSWTAVELDNITGNIAKYLYPNADVRVQGFENAKIINGYMDAVIGNVPFGNFGVADRRYPKYVTNLIHNYFIARSLDTLREGGVACLITSSGTMDSKSDDARRYFMKQADLIGAIRLPNTAFKGTGTNVSTDILVFKKRADGTPYSGENFIIGQSGTYYPVNEYFTNHRDMILGTPERVRDRFGNYVTTYNPIENGIPLEKQIENAFSNITAKMDYPKVDNHKAAREAIKEARNNKEGTAYKKDGKLFINNNGIEQSVNLDAKKEAIYSSFVDIRDTARELVNAMSLCASDKDISKLRTELNRQYDEFRAVYKNGFHDASVRKVILNDTDYAFVQDLEKVENKKIFKNDIFTKNTINPAVNITSVETIEDGIKVSINELGYIDTKRIADLMHTSESDIITKLNNGNEAFKDVNGNFVSAETYLSGNVRAKIKEAEALAEADSSYKKNVEALNKVLPEYIKGSDITVNVGVTWIPAEYYGQFAAELFNIPQSDISVTYNPNGGYDVDFSGSWAVRMSPENTKIWGSKNMPFFYESERKPGLLFSLLNNKDLTVKYKDPDGNTIYDTAATEELKNLKDKINDEFNKWLWKDADRRAELEEVYNDSFNCMVRPSYHADVTIAGQAADIKLREHQGKAVNRITQSPYNTLLQHGAGAGKTYAMIGAAMKLRQLGIAKKPVIVVPKNKIGDWRNDFFKMFPSAKVLVADDTTFAKANRKVFINKIATTDVDAIIMSKEQFQYIPMTKEYQEQFYQSQIDSCIAAIEEARTSKGKNKSTSRQIEKRKSQLEKKLKELGETKKDYDNISFEDTGIDYIFADEAQSYKNLMYNTNRSNVADMGAPDGNQITFDMLMKSNYMRSKQNGKGLVFGTATPVMNSPVEAYTMLKYLANEELEKRGIRNLDNFIDMFGRIESQTRQDAVGRNWTTRNAFSGFINMNEWQQLWGMITDVVKTQDVPGIVLPKMKGGDRNVIVCEAGDAARDIIEGLADRLKKNEKKGENHVFALQSDGKKASFSQRLIDPSLPYGENEKVPVAVNEIYKIWNESKTFTDKDGNTQKNGVQLVFCDYGVPKDSNSKTKSDEEFNPNAEISDERVNVYQDMKDMLVAKGVPSDEIAFIHDAKNDSQRDALYDKVRSGEVRVLIGSSKKMGEGLNVQDRIVALHEMNPLARPGDIEQVEARAIRQGNLSPEVAVNVYVTKDTFDTKQWDTLRNKAKFIAEITRGEYTGRNADFSSDEFGASAADIMAISSGNPLLKEQVETNDQLRKLENLEKAFKRKVYDAQVELDKSQKQINHYKELLPKYQADAKKVRDVSGDNFIGRVSGKTLTKRKDFGVGLIEASKKAINSSEDIVKVGTFGGLDLYVSGITPMAELRGEASYTSKLNYDSPEGTVTRLTNVLEGVKNKAKEAETIIKANEKNIPKLQEIIDSKFDKESELSEVRNRAKDIEAQLLVSDNDAITSSNNEVLSRKNGKQKAVYAEGDRSAEWIADKSSDNKVTTPKRLSDIIADIQHEFGMNITVGHIRNRDTAGEFNTRDKGAKTRTANDLPTIAHELGHWFDDQYKITSSTVPKEVEADFKKALGTLADEYMPSLRTKEGMAEFFRKYLQNREIAAIDYPEATKYLLSKLSPLDLVRITSLADQVNAYYSMGAKNAQGSIRLNEDRIIDRRTKFEKVIDKKDQIYQAMVDSNHGIRLMGKSVGNNSAYISAANAAYSDARTEQIILGDLTDYDGNYVDAGLKTVLHGLDTNPEHDMYGDFGEYLILKHGQEFLAQGKRVFASDKMNSTQWMQNRLEELDEKYPEFEKMSYRLYNFLTEFTQTWAVDTGLISQDDFNRMQALYPNYVPFFRAGFKTRGNSLSRAKGSGRDIINPIDNIINMVTKTVNTATRNHVLLDIRKVALDEGVDASFIEKIPDPLVPKKFDARGLKAQLANDSFDIMAENNASFEVMDAMQTLIDNINDTLIQFEIGKARGDVIQMLVNGKKEFWKVNDKLLLDSITNMNAHTANAVLNAYGKMTRFMTSNVTGRNIIWSIFSNMPRDIQTAYTYFDGYNPLPLIKGIGSAYLNSFRHAAGKSVAPYFSEYLSMGGGGAGVWQGQESYVSDMRKKLNTVNPKSFNMFESIAFVSNTIEMGPRFAMYVHLREHGRNQQQAFYEAMDLTVNFRRHGTVSRDINKVSQFFNASVQGVDKSVRFFTGEDIKGTNPKQRAMAVKKRVGMYIAISAALAAMNYAINNTDDEKKKYYQLMSSYTKNSYFLIPLNEKGEYFAIPKARELSVLTSMFERILEYSLGGNKHAFDDFYSYWGENCLPNIISEFVQFPFRIADNGLNQAIEDTVAGVLGSMGIIGVLAENMANRDFLGRPIVSNTYKERMPKDQYDAKTSEFAYLLGNALNVSPKKIDHFADNTLGVMWEVPAAVLPIDDGKGTKGERDWTVGIKNKYRKSAAYSNDISNWIYDERSKSEAKANHNEDDIDAAIAYKMDNLYASFYTNFNKLNKNNHTSSQKEAKYSVLDMLVGYRNAKENGIYPDGMVAIMSVIKNSKDISLLPNAMNTYVKDKDKKQFDLSDVRYVEYQTLYNKYYFENAEDQLDLSSDINTQVSVLKKCKEAAKNKATNDMLKLFSGAKIDRSEDNAGMNIAKSNYKAALTEAREKDENHEITDFEKYELAIEYAKKSKDKTFTAEDFYYDSLDKDSKAKYDSWTKAGGSFDNYDELLELNDIPADKKSNGNSIPNSKKNKVADAITSQGWNEKLMQIAWERAGYKDDLDEYMSTKKYNYTGYRVNGASSSGTSNKKAVNSTSSLNSSWTGMTF